jgi:HSP20 family protein
MASTLTKPESSSPAIRGYADPFSSFRAEMDDLISRFWGGDGKTRDSQSLMAAVDVSETENAFEIRMDVPGMAAKDFDIQVQGNIVTLSGKRQEEKEEKGKTFHRIERHSGSFSRTVTLPCDVNEDEVAAQYSDGVLSLTLPKSEKSRVKKIAVKS